jgi:photosystem II stability/assembly factor-like uncharacterized protein
MKTKIIFSLLFIFTISLNAQWLIAPSGTTNFINSIQGITTTKNYAAGFSGTVLKSTNSGQNWITVTSPAATNINKIFFPATGTATTGWAGGVSGLFKTTNAGDNWTQQLSGSVIADVNFTDLNTGLVISSGTSVSKTTNGGTNFTAANFTSNGAIHGAAIAPTNGTIFYILGTDNTNDSTFIFKSTNAGTSWSQVFRTPGFYFAIFFVNTTTGIMCGDLGKIKRTTDAGVTWTSISSGTTNDLLGIQFISTTKVYISGQTGTILKSTNGGLNWVQQVSNTTANLRSIFVYPTDDFGFAAGQAGIIVRTTNGGVVTGFVQNENEVPQNYSLQQNYPNPFNPSTNIKFSIVNAGIVQIKVYDMLGKERATLVNQNLSAGTYKTEFDASALPSGTYFYRITAAGYTETRKMILIK